jgi:hypothetical protein
MKNPTNANERKGGSTRKDDTGKSGGKSGNRSKGQDS